MPEHAVFPASDTGAGWSRPRDDDELRRRLGLDPARLRILEQAHRTLYQGPWAIVVIRHGQLAWEAYAEPGMPGTSYDLWSSTKSVASLGVGIALQAGRRGQLDNDRPFELSSRAYDWIPEGHPLTDPRKQQIEVGHLLSMTSGIAGESAGLISLAVRKAGDEFPFALGQETNRYGASTAQLLGPPGSVWDYSDAAYAHLSLVVANAVGWELDEIMADGVFGPIGISSAAWDRYGGAGGLGPHTNAQSGLHMSARDFARLGLLTLHRGRWRDQQLVPAEWIDAATQPSSELNPSYGYGFWLNGGGRTWPSAPIDTFAFQGYASTRCYVVPSLGLVIARLGYGPPGWDEGSLLPEVLGALTDP